jgi:hypothetical protein
LLTSPISRSGSRQKIRTDPTPALRFINQLTAMNEEPQANNKRSQHQPLIISAFTVGNYQPQIDVWQ